MSAEELRFDFGVHPHDKVSDAPWMAAVLKVRALLDGLAEKKSL